jgi:hypothetical protein
LYTLVFIKQETKNKRTGYKIIYKNTNSRIINTKTFCINYQALYNYSLSFIIKYRIIIIIDFICLIICLILDIKNK